MKKTFMAILITVIFVFATACGNAKKEMGKTTLTPTFTCTARIAYDDFSAVAEIQRYGEGMWSAEFSEPSTLSGVRLDFADGEVTASYKGLTFSVPKDAAPVKALISSLIEVVDMSLKADFVEGQASDGVITLSGSLSQGDYTISFDEKTGALVSFEMPGYGLKMVFENFNAGTALSTTSTSTVTQGTSEGQTTETTAQTEQTVATAAPSA